MALKSIGEVLSLRNYEKCLQAHRWSFTITDPVEWKRAMDQEEAFRSLAIISKGDKMQLLHFYQTMSHKASKYVPA